MCSCAETESEKANVGASKEEENERRTNELLKQMEKVDKEISEVEKKISDLKEKQVCVSCILILVNDSMVLRRWRLLSVCTF